MWQNWLIGILGLWIILLPFLALPLKLQSALIVISGILISVLGFWSASGPKETSI